MPYLEWRWQSARKFETRRHFGNSINLFTPLYIKNYGENIAFTAALTAVIKSVVARG